MSNDQDFNAAASDIYDRIVMISDVQLVMMIKKWLSKLMSSEHRNANELNYLKLLQYMVANKRIGRPFVREPPSGPLFPLGKYINPPPLSRVLLQIQDRRKAGTSWRTSNCSKAVQTVEQQYDDSDTVNFLDGENVENHSHNNNHNGVSNANNDGVLLLTNTDANIVTGVSSNENADHSNLLREQETSSNTTWRTGETKRNGYLAGGECYLAAKCGEERNPAKNFDQLITFCNPCLDDLGRFKKKTLHFVSNDATYKDLLEDCVYPVFTETEQKSVCPELLQILRNVNNHTTLQDFYFQVSLFTCDQGVLLMSVSDELLDNFRIFTKEVFESRTEHISDGLSKEQMMLKDKYTYLQHRMLNRATVVYDFLHEVMPTFNWSKYQENPHIHMKQLVLRHIAPPMTDSKENDEDDIDNQQSVVLKKLLYTLNSLRSEVTRVECEEQRLNEQHNKLLASVAEANTNLLTIQCQSSADIERHKNELTLLLQRSAEQTITVDRLMESIQSAMQKNQPSPSSLGC